MDKPKSERDVQKPETLWSNDHFIEHNQQLQVFFENEQFCDVTLVSSDDKYKVKAHKMFLASISKYFLAMFGGSLAESNSSEVKLSQIDGNSLELIVVFIYNGMITVSPDTVESVLMGAHILQLSVLEKLCCSYIKKSIDVSNCLGIADLAQRHNFSDLYEAASLCACENFPDIKYADEFNLLSVDQLCGLIARDELRASSECEIFECILEWINYKKDDRKQFLEKLLTYVRFPLLSPSFIGRIIEKTGESIETFRIVTKAFTWHTAPSWHSTIFPREQSKIRNFKDVIVAISGCENVRTDLRVGLYYSGLKEWIYTKWPGLPCSRKKLVFTIVNKKLLIAGADECMHRVECLNLVTLRGTKLPDVFRTNMNTYSYKTMITSNGAVYLLSNDNVYKIVEPFTNWITFNLFNSPYDPRPNAFSRSITSSNIFAVYNGLIYYPDNQENYYYSINIAECSNEKKIERAKIHNSPIIGVHIVKDEGRFYLIEIQKRAAVTYDLETNKKILQNDISFDESCSRTALHGKKIILYGGKRMYEYNVFTNKMLALPHLPKDIDNVDVLISDSNSGMQ